MAMNALHHAALSFVAQNYGAGKHRRIKKVVFICAASVTIVGATLGPLCLLFGKQLVGIFATDAKVVEYTLIKLHFICATYAPCGIMDVLVRFFIFPILFLGQ